MEFTTDARGQEILLKDGEFQVMMEWEKPYMQACIDMLQPSGDVLEIGFGLGYSANAIQTHNPSTHTIIEYHPVVAKKAREWAQDKPNVRIVEGTWQEVLPTLGKYDAIFFDDYPLESAADVAACKSAEAIASGNLKEIDAIQKEVAQFKPKAYTDADLQFLFDNMKDTSHLPGSFYQKFFTNLLNQNEITADQFSWVQNQLNLRGIVLEDPPQRRGPGDRLLQFLEPCLKNHLKTHGRFSCYLERTESLYQEKAFKKLIINNPFLDYQEKTISITPSPLCKYFTHNEAIVMKITKLS
ncbi:MAG: class I SAM-dependent methyltransferase [Chlamydiales bacterium]|nr:class I SAM-dependent methyltransferase [Chlamydiales bacterium]